MARQNDAIGNRSPHSLSDAQKLIIKATVPILAEHGHNITTQFYKNLFAAHPDLQAIFNIANQRDGSQPRALAAALNAYASNIDDLGALSSAVELITHKHASLCVRPEHYAVVGKYLLQTMKDVLGDAMTDEISQAWEVAYWQLAYMLIDAEYTLYSLSMGWTDWKPFRIAKKAPESNEITSFYLEPVDGSQPLPSYLPGQYISIRTEVAALGRKQPRQYSLSDAPNGKNYRISIKREAGVNIQDPQATAQQGYVSNVMHREKHEDDVIELSHPFGTFHLHTNVGSTTPVVFLAAGVGITALISMFNALLQQRSPRPITFAHGARNASLRAFGDHLQCAAAEHENISVVLFNKEQSDDGSECSGYARPGRLEISKLDPDGH